jgi:SAM-dependent methyltransferase
VAHGEEAALTPRAEGDSGRLPSLGQDHATGHKTYVEQLTEGGRLWLRTKPFYAPPTEELTLCLRTFAHIVEQLGLGLRAQVLDVGCGPGWLSEFLVRCGYWVTGIDISEDMVAIARERVAALEQPIGEGIEPVAEFHAMPVRELPWSDRFDAAILYDTMHHFDDEEATLEVILRSLVPGGRIYIREGARPAPGSEGERQLIEEMELYGTLESPFDPAYLEEVVAKAGFTDVRRFVEVDELVEVGDVGGMFNRLRKQFSYRVGRSAPETNILIATKPLDGGAGAGFSAEITADGSWHPNEDGRSYVLQVRIRNTGDTFWPTGPFGHGVITIGPYVPLADGSRREFQRVALPRAVPPGKELTIELAVQRNAAGDAAEIAVDCVREGIAWFSDLGSTPLVAPVAR